MAAGGRRARLRAELRAEVLAATRLIVVDHGVETLTLTEVARKVGVTPAALYHHFDRGLPDIVSQAADDIVDDLVGELTDSAGRFAADNFAMRMIAPSRVLRSWAIGRRREFCFLFGTPAEAAGDEYAAVTTRWILRLAGVWGPAFVDLWAARGYPVASPRDLDPRLLRQMHDYATASSLALPPEAALVMLNCWRALYGQVTLEAFGHFSPLLGDQEPMFEMLMRDIMSSLGLAEQYEAPTRG
ncbi:TetR/AcrR family transcriptional regulator [Streptomyces sp. SID4982]|uniref:WHG domain-containing protein n=1 Tax=Streptomyces sp. SID4982 TaxID=2690291 RepID=UPI00136B7769|nr:TetR family transcriptional regulator [Streptomyces sp. SID4982]